MTDRMPTVLMLELSESVSSGLLDAFVDENTTSHIEFNQEAPEDAIVGDAPTVQTGELVTATIGSTSRNVIQLDGITEHVFYAADTDRLSGLTTTGSMNLIARPDTAITNAEVWAAISDDVSCNDTNDSFLFRSWTDDRMRTAVRYAPSPIQPGGGALVNGTWNHFRITFDTTGGTQLQSFFVDDMSTAVATLATSAEAVIQNAGVRVLSFGALSDSSFHAGISLGAFSISKVVDTWQHPDFT